MKITIEHEQITATTTSLVLAQRLLETIKELDRTSNRLGKPDIVIPAEHSIVKVDTSIFDVQDTSDIPEEVIKPKLPPFKPAWLERHIDFKKSKLCRYSNPCSALHGKCGQQCWQTELLIDTGGKLDTCDCEFYEIDELRNTLDAYIKHYSNGVLEKQKKTRPACSTKRLQEVAVLINQGCTNKQIQERLSLSYASVVKYKTDCKKAGLLKKGE